MYLDRFQDHLYNVSALSRFEVLTTPIYICNEDRPYYSTQNPDIFIQYKEGFNFATSKPSFENKFVHKTVPNNTVINILQCLFGVICSAFNAYNLKLLLGPDITLSKIFTSGFLEYFLKPLFIYYKLNPIIKNDHPQKSKQKPSVDSSTPHSQIELNLLKRSLKFPSPVHNNFNKQGASTLPTKIKCCELPVESQPKPNFK